MLFSIIVLSYNRPEQIERILKNLLTASSENFNLIIKDDCSPRHDEIEDIVQFYKKNSKYEIIFHKNKENLGYDKNLLDSFNITDSEYIFLLSDDDYIDGRYISELSGVLEKREHKIYFTPYHFNGHLNRRNINPYNLDQFEEIIYNSILFSGLIFDRFTVLSTKKDEVFLSNCIYTQVYLASVIIFNEKSFGEVTDKLLHLGGDGENFFGKNQSAVNNEILKDRSSVVADLRYQVFLLEVVKKIANSTTKKILPIFMREYNLRLIGYLMKTRRIGLIPYKMLIKELRVLKIEMKYTTKIFIIMIYMLPSKICDLLYKQAVFIFRKAG